MAPAVAGAQATDPAQEPAAAEGAEEEPAEAELPWWDVEGQYWSHGEPRFFASLSPEAGVIYAKPYVSVGYGIPHWIWAGLDFNAIGTLGMTQVYAGLRAATPVLNVAFGVRDTWSLTKQFPLPGPRLTAADVEDTSGPLARYWAWELDIVAMAPLPYSLFVAELIVVRTLDNPRDRYLFDESYRVVIADPTFANLRLAALARFGPEDAIRVGVLGEHLFETGRAQTVWRVGPIVSAQVTDHLEFRAGVTVTVYSPDDLGLILGSYGVAGFAFRWASGEERPVLPWEGRSIIF